MNWTGGSLQRCKNANKGIVQKQKAHFARARTQLQNGLNILTSPSPPNFYRDEQKGPSGRLSSINSQAARPTDEWGVSQKQHRKVDSPLNCHDHVAASREFVEGNRAQRRELKQVADSRETTGGASGEKRKVVFTDSEELLLEARRKRLLQRQDWACLMHSKPVTMQFQSREEKGQIGKRRKTKPQHAQTRSKGGPSYRLRELPTDRSEQPLPYMRDAVQNENIRIRIGTDALANFKTTHQTPTPIQEAVVSENASSDTMLFDYEDVHIASKYGLQPDEGDQDPRTFVGVHTQARAAPQRMRGEDFQSLRGFSREAAARKSPHRKGRPDAVERAWEPRSLLEAAPSTGAGPEHDKVSGAYITQHSGGVARPLRLVVDCTSDSSASVGDPGTWQGDVIGETNCAYNLANARQHENGNGPGSPDAGCAIDRAPQIVDESPWMSFLPVPDGSSSMSAANAWTTDKRYLTNQPLRNVERVSWSQHASQGDRTRIDSSSCVSASLPSITRRREKGTLGKWPHDGGERGQPSEKRQRDENEQLWQRFVFDSADTQESNTTHGMKVVEEDTTTRAMMASCSAKGLLSSTPFNSTIVRASSVSESVQDSAGRAPHTTSSGSMLPMIASGEAQIGTEETAERSDSGDNSVSHTSTHNVSCDTDASPSRGSSHSRTRVSRNGLGLQD